MFGNSKKKPKRAKIDKGEKVDSFVGPQTEVRGDLSFAGKLLVDGVIKGNVSADEDSSSVLYVNENGTIEGEVRVPNVLLNGVVIGDVHAKDHIELATNARITGNVYYTLIEMAIGAEVNGNLVHKAIESEPQLKLAHDAPIEVAE